jgi:hypothetical protein
MELQSAAYEIVEYRPEFKSQVLQLQTYRWTAVDLSMWAPTPSIITSYQFCRPMLNTPRSLAAVRG